MGKVHKGEKRKNKKPSTQAAVQHSDPATAQGLVNSTVSQESKKISGSAFIQLLRTYSQQNPEQEKDIKEVVREVLGKPENINNPDKIIVDLRSSFYARRIIINGSDFAQKIKEFSYENEVAALPKKFGLSPFDDAEKRQYEEQKNLAEQQQQQEKDKQHTGDQAQAQAVKARNETFEKAPNLRGMLEVYVGRAGSWWDKTKAWFGKTLRMRHHVAAVEAVLDGNPKIRLISSAMLSMRDPEQPETEHGKRKSMQADAKSDAVLLYGELIKKLNPQTDTTNASAENTESKPVALNKGGDLVQRLEIYSIWAGKPLRQDFVSHGDAARMHRQRWEQAQRQAASATPGARR